MLLVHHPELEGGGGAEDVLGPRGVLHAGELHHDAAVPLALDHGLGHPELVDPVAKGRHVLLEGELPGGLDRLLVEYEPEPEVLRPEVLLRHREVRKLAFGAPRGLVPRLRRTEPHLDPPLGVPPHRAVPHPGFPQQGAHVAGVPLLGLGHRGRHVDLHEEVHPAAKIEAEVHRQQAGGGEPPRHGGSEVEGDDVAGAEVGAQDVLGLELGLGVAEAGEESAVLQGHRMGGNPSGLERAGDAGG